MSDYLVSWQIDIEADSPKEAAEEAYQIMSDPNSLARFFTVQSEGGVEVSVEVDQ